jgi:hypothetical protein
MHLFDFDRAWLIQEDGTVREVAPQNGTDFQLEEMYKLLGVEMIQIVPGRSGWQMVIDEEGKINGLRQPNKMATAIYPYGAQDPVWGPALVCPNSMIK